MPTFIKPGFWEKARKGYDHWLNLDLLIAQAIVPSTLQQVLNTNHDLVDGLNFQGTDAGLNNTGIDVIGFGTSAASGNTGYDIVALGKSAGRKNSGSEVVALGTTAGSNNTGNNIVALGQNAGFENTGYDIVALGINAGRKNSGSDVIFIGRDSGDGNTLSGMTIISNNSLPSYLDKEAAELAITIALGAISGNTYLYYNETTHSIGGVRL
tara:strand:+ start:92 stop:724 length:633 start_codon:yes stop_codon:yes gene_type:complete